MMMAAMWLQETEGLSPGNLKLLLILITVFIGLVAIAMIAQAVVQIGFSIKATKAIAGLVQTVDEIKLKAMPMIDSMREITLTTQSLISDTAPKVKIITENLLQTSEMVRASAQQIDKTVADANFRTQRQVARVDGMVTAALTTTAEIVETVNHGIRVPAQKIAALAGQARFFLEDLMGKAKSMAAALPFGNRE